MKKTRKRMGSLLISLCVVFSMLPIVAFADPTTEITAFETLADDVRLKEVPLGTTLAELNLPTTLNATTSSTFTVTVSNWVSNPAYDPNNVREYIFTPNLPADVILASGVTLPTITVKVFLTVDPLNYTLDPLEYGYGQYSYLEDAQPKTFTITNTGDTELTNLVLSQYNTGGVYWFDLSYNFTKLDPHASAEFTVNPVSGLLPGTYTHTIFVVSNNKILVEVPISLTVTQRAPRLKFSETDIHEVDTDFSGTGYNWNATTKTLTLTSDYAAGTIEFLDFHSETMTLKLDGDVTIDETASSRYCLYNSGNLTIDLGGHTLTLITGGYYHESLYGTTFKIQDGTLVARLQGSGTREDTKSIDATHLTIENATVIADADSQTYGGMCINGSLTLKQGAKIYTCGANALMLDNANALNLDSDNISLTAIGSSVAVCLDADLNYTSGSALKYWTNTDAAQPSPVGDGALLSSKTRDELEFLWWNSKYAYIGTQSPKSIVTVTNGTGSGEYSQNAVVNITANKTPSGKQFKEWTVVSGGVTLANAKALSTTFTMPANAVEITATYEDIPVGVTPVTGITLNKTTLSLYSNTGTKTANLIATISPADATDKSITWQSSNTAVATVDKNGLITAVGNGTANITVTTTDGGYTTSCAVTVSTYTSSGDSGGGSSSGGSSPKNTATIKENQPNQAVTATIGTNGLAIASISDKAVTDAIAKAQAEATKQDKTQDGISIGLNVTMPKGTTSLRVTLSQSALISLVSAGVTNLEINGSPVSIRFDQKALREILKETNGNININIVPQPQLSEKAKTIIGTRPVYNITVSYGNNSTVTSFGQGVATVSIPYTPSNGEVISGLHAVYVDQHGNATRVDGSAYDAKSGSILFTTPHFSLYGVGYTQPSAEFTDISNHWAKESIGYVVEKGMIDGATKTTFEPDTFMSRKTLVTALGRLTNEDISKYTTSSFTDVQTGSNSQPYIEWAYKKGIIHGIGNSEFAPDRAITREEIAVIIANFTKATGYIFPVTYEATTYSDESSIGSSYKTAVKTIQQAGIMTGGTNNKFNPKSNATRAEVSSMLHRYIMWTVTSDNTDKD